jgi:murein DD-endopeptidase MepM/ murein hydrolase activator NlpD
MLRRFVPTLVVLFAAVGMPSHGDEAPLALDLPIKCHIGTDCFVQQYFDHDPGRGAKDYRCGTMVYDGHDGIDIRVPTLVLQKRGVPVIAAAPGIVAGTRDGMPDTSVSVGGAASVKDRECGNGVLIRHRDGWETQYCHMANGSVRVAKGQTVMTGSALGLVGESGNAAFFHLHLSVRHNGTKVDPFANGAKACGTGRSLWTAAAAKALAYRSPDVINVGFSDGAVSMGDVESGRAGAKPLRTRSPALVAFVRAIGLKRGDVQTLSVVSPDGTAIGRNAAAALDRDKAQWLMFAGKRLTMPAWPPGRYVARYEVMRDGQLAAARTFRLELP